MRNYKRDEVAYKMHKKGLTYVAIGKYFGVTGMRASQLVHRHHRFLFGPGNCVLRGKHIHLPLSCRIINCLRNANITDLEQVEGLTEKQLLRTPNFGKKSLAELETVCRHYGVLIGKNCHDHYQYQLFSMRRKKDGLASPPY